MNRRATLQAVCCVRVSQPLSFNPRAFGASWTMRRTRDRSDVSRRTRRGNLRTHPLRATKVGSWADFSGNLAHFCPNSHPHRATMNSALDWLGPFCCLQPCGRIAESGYLGESRCSCVPLPDRQGAGSIASLRIVQKAARRAGVEEGVSPHWLRHAHATHSLERGSPIHLVQGSLWATPPLRLPAGICTRDRASRAPRSSWRDEGEFAQEWAG